MSEWRAILGFSSKHAGYVGQPRDPLYLQTLRSLLNHSFLKVGLARFAPLLLTCMLNHQALWSCVKPYEAGWSLMKLYLWWPALTDSWPRDGGQCMCEAEWSCVELHEASWSLMKLHETLWSYICDDLFWPMVGWPNKAVNVCVKLHEALWSCMKPYEAMWSCAFDNPYWPTAGWPHNMVNLCVKLLEALWSLMKLCLWWPVLTSSWLTAQGSQCQVTAVKLHKATWSCLKLYEAA